MMIVRLSPLPAVMVALALLLPSPAPADDSAGPGVVGKPAAKSEADSASPKPPLPKQRGVASYYGKRFNHKKTASGELLDPNKKTAASKTLPIGTKAEVTNKENGKKTEVVVTDRGPYVKDRVIDVTPKAAEELDMKKEGVTQVEVKPIEVPKTEEEKKEAVKNPPQ